MAAVTLEARIVGGGAEGRLEVKPVGGTTSWRSVCNTGLTTDVAALVACRTVFNGTAFVVSAQPFKTVNSYTNFAGMTDFVCPAEATNLGQCS